MERVITGEYGRELSVRGCRLVPPNLARPPQPCSRKGPIGETAINRGNCLSAGPGEFEFLVKFPVNGVRHPETRSA